MHTTSSPLPWWRRALAAVFGALAVFWLALIAVVLVVGGVRYDFATFSVSATHLSNPLIFMGASVLLGWLCVPGQRLRETALGRTLLALRAVAAEIPRSRRSRVALAALLILGAWSTYRHVRQWHHISLGDQLTAEGRDQLAAEQFKLAINFADPDTRPLRERAGYSYWRAGMHEECVAELEPYFKAGKYLGRRGSRALWNCYWKVGQHEAAIEVVRYAMGVHPELGNHCAGALAEMERDIGARTGKSTHVTFVVPAQPGHDAATPVLLRGNWDRRGRPADATGWDPVPMGFDAQERRWTAGVTLGPSGDFPYTAVASTASGGTSSVLASLQFELPADSPAAMTLELLPDGPPTLTPTARRAGADGQRRVLALWPDAGSWFLVGSYAHRGYLPNIAKLLRDGARGEMISTNPPFTSTAYVRMVELEPGVSSKNSGGLVETAMLQLKGIPFLDALLPDRLVSRSEGPTLFSVLAQHGRKAANLVFSDKFVAAPSDMRLNDGTQLVLDETALSDGKEERELNLDEETDIMRSVLRFDPETDPERAATITGNSIFLLGVENTEHKAREGLRIWREGALDFMLLRFPSIDILSHKYFWTVRDNPQQNLMLEAYRHLDDVVGRFVAELDEDDTLIFVSDHGISGTLHHHRTCVLIAAGPGLPPGSTFDTLPIGHFPSVVLSRFGLEDAEPRLSDASYSFWFGKKRASQAPTTTVHQGHPVTSPSKGGGSARLQ